MRLQLQLEGYAQALNGTVSPAYNSIQFPSNDESGIWRAHAAQCYPSAECPAGEAGPVATTRYSFATAPDAPIHSIVPNLAVLRA